MVRLTRIYTRLGDGGDTHLGDMSRVRKTDPRVVAYGDVDELNTVIGLARNEDVPDEHDGWLARVQNDLFDLGADLCVPESSDGVEKLRITADQVTRLEGWCDQVNETLPNLTSFVLPGGTAAAAWLHLARTVCRRAERSTVALGDVHPINEHAVTYLNRLSDLLFILARGANAAGGGGDVMWVPGGPAAG
jgi:cob(I)alamin adenosyltransferase